MMKINNQIIKINNNFVNFTFIQKKVKEAMNQILIFHVIQREMIKNQNKKLQHKCINIQIL